MMMSEGEALPCGCIPHVLRLSPLSGNVCCETEDNPYCNFECPHDDEGDSDDE